MTTAPRDWQLGTAFVIGAGTVCVYVVAYSLGRDYRNVDETIANVVLFFGILAALLLNRGWRDLGFAPFLYSLLVLFALLTQVVHSLKPFLFAVAMFVVGMVAAQAARTILRNSAARWSLHWLDCLLVATFVLLPPVWIEIQYFSDVDTRTHLDSWNFALFVGLCLVLMGYSWLRLIRPAYELWVESWVRPMYRIRGAGPGLRAVPPDGPLLLIANHACWWDPLFLAGVVDRPITPMMTASFFDIWHLRPFMTHVIRAIRVPEKAMRHDAPEIQEAVAALRRGECVVIFPEGYLRRKDDMPLRRFGRGVWEILKGAPDTPVLAAWIEGGWGSWCSWKDGPPTKNKRIDIRRPILVGLSEPVQIPPDVLEHHWAARMHLMNLVSGARRHAGLEPLPPFAVPAAEDTEEAAT